MWETVLAQIGVGIVIAVTSAVVTVQLSLGRFRSERWWDRKEEAYSKIVEALYHWKRHVDAWVAREELGQTLPEDKMDELDLLGTEAREEIGRAIDIGTFIISEDGVSCLETLHAELNEATRKYHPKDFSRYIDAEQAALGKCLKAIRDCAKRDLEVDRAPVWRRLRGLLPGKS